MTVVKSISQVRLTNVLKKLGFKEEEQHKNKFVIVVGTSVVEFYPQYLELCGLYNISLCYEDIKRIIIFKTSFLINFNFELKNGELLAYGLLLKKSVSNLNKNLVSKTTQENLKKNGIKTVIYS